MFLSFLCQLLFELNPCIVVMKERSICSASIIGTYKMAVIYKENDVESCPIKREIQWWISCFLYHFSLLQD